MIRYIFTAQALKLFSLNEATRSLYRFIGNTLVSRRRASRGLPANYVERCRGHLQFLEKHDVIRDGLRGLELGTGWVHWDSIVLRLFYDVEIVLFDVWDNRQLSALHRYLEDFKNMLGDIEVGAERKKAAAARLGTLLKTTSFQEIYDLLGFKYVINPEGILDFCEDASFDLVFSSDVLEHITLKNLDDYICSIARVLRPGGYSFHQIVTADHLASYDQSVHPKNYLRYSDAVWKGCFENSVQYINRVQRARWTELFQNAGLLLVDQESCRTDISSLTINEKYRYMQQADLECTVIKLLHRKSA